MLDSTGIPAVCKARLLRSVCVWGKKKKSQIMSVMRIFMQTGRNQSLSLIKLVNYKYSWLRERE